MATTRKNPASEPVRYWLGREVTDRRTRILCAAQEVFANQGFRSDPKKINRQPKRG